ncbi:putative 46 kDa FK506-binding nuclear protein-like [Apostichopus japonicus]|uniref:Putative 46 kDa FK506-binding nuclear protein-like n=1 Tax=Stichopus japonicus TaxID=307972 RepID=A0A2G8LNJ4_STIJA|nr:putative 46 kDa FK506-binding nuclear protein-like [Apostichopus japonicus]
MFWGLTLKPGKRHTEIFSEEICLSMATLESRKDFGERPDNYSHVVVKTQKSDFLLCTLVHGLQFQQNLNLKLMPKEKITFRVQGTSKVYLTGFSPSCPVEDVDIGEEEEEEDEEETLNQAGASQEQKDGDQEDAGWLVDDCDTADDIVEDVIEALSGEELNRPEDQPGQSGRGAMSGGKEDNFLSVTELSNLPVKEEGMEECDSEISQEHSKNQISEGGRKEVRSKSSSSLITDNIDEDGSSMEGSGDEWILDEGEDVEEPEEDVSEVEEGVEDDDGSVGERQQIAKVPCDVCDQEFNTEEEKLKHEENDHRLSPPNSQVQLTNSSLVKKRRTYKCRYCNKLLANINSKKRHEAIHAREQKLFTCQHCPKVFSYHHNLVRHRKMHKPTSMLYRCLICNAGFQHIQLRDKHVLGHFKKDAQRCDLCRQVTCKGECMPTEEILNSQSLEGGARQRQDGCEVQVRTLSQELPVESQSQPPSEGPRCLI